MPTATEQKPWTVSDPPPPAVNWTQDERERCVAAANAVLEDGGTDEEAVMACIGAAGKATHAPGRERKTLPLLNAKALDDGAGLVEGYGSVFGEIDSYGDTVDRGAYADTLAEFLKTGFIAHGHDWNDYIATVKSAHEDARGLYIVGEYHTDPDAQKVRTRVAERLARGQAMGLSIGYEALEWETRKVETPFRDRWGELTDQVRALTRIKLYEVSLVAVPAEPRALVTTAKSLHLPYEDHSESVRVAVAEWLERTKAGSAMRAKVGRAISEARRTRMATVSGSLREAADEIDAMLEETAPPPKSEDQPGGSPSGAPTSVLRLRHDTERLLAHVARTYGVRTA